MPNVIILLPGTLGSEIILDGQKVWPGSLPQFLTGFSAQDFNKLLDPRGVAGDIIRNFAIIPQYASLVKLLDDCGFHEYGQPPTLYICAYDWRKSCREAAKTLDAKVQQVNREHGGNAQITLIVHSMGGLVARYYLESKQFSNANSPGFDSIDNLYTLATPHLGAPIAVIKALGQDKTVFLSAAQIKTLALNPLYPSLYELFPRRDQEVVWNLASRPAFLPVDLYGGGGVAAGLSAQNLQAADSFQQSLNPPVAGASRVRYFFFSGTQKKTAINLTARPGATAGAIAIDKSERDDAGDGTVPIWSSRFGNFPTEYAGGEHSEIYKDSQLQKTLKQLLGVPEMEARLVVGLTVDVTITTLVLRPGEVSQLDIVLSDHITNLSGRLSFERAVLGPDEKLEEYIATGTVEEIIYEGPSFDRLRIQFKAPAEPGIYQVTFTLADESAQGKDQFFVQSHPTDQ